MNRNSKSVIRHTEAMKIKNMITKLKIVSQRHEERRSREELHNDESRRAKQFFYLENVITKENRNTLEVKTRIAHYSE